MSLHDAYAQNYDQIARDYVAHWRVTNGGNPFQNADEQKAHESATVALVEKYVAFDSSLLDAGCAMGDLMLRLDAYDVKGCDIAEPLLEIARERGLDVVNSFIEQLTFLDESFDAVVTTDTLEHVLDLNAALKELLRVLRPGGILLIRVPDQEDLGQYLGAEVPYRFIHLRRFDQASASLFLTRVFDLEILEMSVANITLNIVCRKP